ncbi:sensor histidine kinase [Rhodopirellula halodulae]|uniref:sensor histidine kinase n=1 Tax=Rhodopirellula halodulae TaxID=2894198 RepID=UPI001E323C20|nr:ATP-binding protein [Rhodopirellula sp. JC737]MCC9655725.1 ATP-binding protein [Rhodopirellula sp. JC737]
MTSADGANSRGRDPDALTGSQQADAQRTEAERAEAERAEAERAAIAGELHDDLLPYLFAAAGSIAALKRKHPELESELQPAAQWIDQAREIARRIMQVAVLPDDFSRGPLHAAKDFLDGVVLSSPTSIALQTHWNGLAESSQWSWAESETIAVYRIVCEAVRNVVRHANASQVTIDFMAQDGGWEIQIRDDGSGFDTDGVPDQSHGMRLMRQRAEDAGLCLKVQSNPTVQSNQSSGAGTQVSLSRSGSSI